MSMKNTEIPALPLAEVNPQERLAYAWAVAQSHAYRSTRVSDRLLDQCRRSTYQLSASDCWQLLAEVPALQVA
jgi:hypothetical protein